jgi:hypothetical protein
MLLPVIVTEKLFDEIYKIHTKRGHIGVDKTYDTVKARSYGIVEVVQEFILLCSISFLKKVQHSQYRLKLIRSTNFWDIIQIDLIDMGGNTCGEYRWITHVMGHFTKYHIL